MIEEALKCYILEHILTASQLNLDTPDDLGIDRCKEGVDWEFNSLIDFLILLNLEISHVWKYEYQSL